MKNVSAIVMILLLSMASCSPKNQNSQDGSFNDTLAVTNLMVQVIRDDLNKRPEIDSITEEWDGKLCTVHYRVDRTYELYQLISMVFGDVNCDSLNDAIATIEYYTGGNRPEYSHLYIQRESDQYKVKTVLPFFGYRDISVNSIENCVIELNGRNWTNSDPACCPSINEYFFVKLNGQAFEIAMDQVAAEFEREKSFLDSLRQELDLAKHKMFKISISEWSEGGFSEEIYFDSLYRLVYDERTETSGDDARTSGYTIYGPDGTILSYSGGGYPNIESIWVNQRIYTKESDTDNTIRYNIREETGNESGRNHKDIIKKISSQEFIYISDSAYYYRETGVGDMAAFDYKVSKISIDSLLFFHLYGDR